MSQEISRQFKIILLGDSGVGKTSLINQYIKGEFDSDQSATVGVEFQAKFITSDGENIKLGIWDTAGQEKFRTLTRQFYRNVDGVILVYDITDAKTLQSIDEYWMQQLQENATTSYQTIIVGNKSDMKETADSDSLVTTQMGQEMARKYSTLFVEASAKTSDHVQNAFDELLQRIKSETRTESEPQSYPQINQPDGPSNDYCC
ncbi:small GTP-binding protein [Tritrichomonas foetus]|uniref:Small GTP-binding protein n=1 Tax=Tritrichomonas foetus TaxID=1144522 RepID=A0A1J4KMB8_9EUKA|nr:small GTP-binding protein [Tritrichomonas foetus]|eukprot:OHT10838.1 small GTP-binding protein [Tritrichomonas foetus]